MDATRMGTAALVGIYATFALDVFSTLNSSPQTTELFASDREDSLMHWVMIGGGVAIAGGAVGAVVSGNAWPLVGAIAVTGGMILAYKYAVKRGLGVPPPEGASE